MNCFKNSKQGLTLQILYQGLTLQILYQPWRFLLGQTPLLHLQFPSRLRWLSSVSVRWAWLTSLDAKASARRS